MTAPQPIEPGVVLLDRYRVDKIVGQGGMGIVAAVWDTELRHHVAFKVLAGIDLNNVQAIERFMREARIAVRLKSEHVVRVMDAGRLPSGTPYMIMELLEGQDLSKQGALPPWTAVDWVLQAIEAIAEAHAQGVIHRDLKPANLFLASRAGAPPIVKVLDFGISKMANVEGDASITGAGAFFGSPRYMSPEQFRSPKLVDARTDVWALGATLYELLTGEPVYSGTLPEIFDAVFHREPLPIHARRPDVPPALEQVIFRCMQKTPDHRYANVAQLAQALAPFGTGEWQRCVERASRLLPGHEVRASAPEVGTAQAPTQHAHVATFAPTQPPTHHALVAPVAPSPGTLAPPDARLARMRIALFVVVPISFVLIVGIVLFVAFPDKWRRVRLHHASVASLAKVSMNATAEKLGEVVHVTPPNREQMTVLLASGPYDAVTFFWSDHLPHVTQFTIANNAMRSPPNIAAIRQKLRTLLGRRFDNDSSFEWQDCRLGLSADGADVMVTVNYTDRATYKEPWQQQIETLWDVVRVAVLGLDVPIAPNAIRDWLGGGYPLATLGSVDVTTNIVRAHDMIEHLYPGATSYGDSDLQETIALDHPWFGQAQLSWHNEHGGRLETVTLGPPPGKEKHPSHGDIDACLQGVLGPPKERSEPERNGNYVTWWILAGGGQISVRPESINIFLGEEKPFMSNATWQKVISTLDACGKGK